MSISVALPRKWGDDDVEGQRQALGREEDVGGVDIPDVEAPEAERKGIFVTQTTPRQQSEAGGDESGGEIVERDARTLKTRLGGDDAPPVRLLLPQADEMDVVAEDVVLPEQALEIVQRVRVVQVGLAIFRPTHGEAAGGGLGVFDPASRRFIQRNVNRRRV